MAESLFAPSAEAQARVLILVAAFTSTKGSLQGRTKLAKLDFFLRYPQYFARALEIRLPNQPLPQSVKDEVPTIETRMIRYRYGPWDPAYFAVLGSLIGRGLIEVIPEPRGLGYRATPVGVDLAAELASNPSWRSTAENARLLKRHFDLTGSRLKNFVYQNFPEVTKSSWGTEL